ncbi:hypothetical protein GIB67_002831 [Kingdonia uniflora]|uniref:F-box domain-containing protein n=1 Tax=Kingdonia uniflora TaxID=39325 RepID=A0A7J7M579_9MAGN|nr:hypothetical protein GIB67_002831 [Kingdonia uniflora]
MPGFMCETKQFPKSQMYFSNNVKKYSSHRKTHPHISHHVHHDIYCPLLSDLPDDVAKNCLALVPRSNFPAMGVVCKQWRSFIQSKDFITVRKQIRKLEEWLYTLTADTKGKGSHWEVLDCVGNKYQRLPQMPGPQKAEFGVVVINGKLLVMGGYLVDEGTGCVSPAVYEYHSCLNRWIMLSNMNVARYDFACTEVNGLVYAVGGHGVGGESLSSAEVYNPEKNEWILIESLRRPRWGCFAYEFKGKVYIMGGRSSFTIGNSRFVDIYDPETHSWCEVKNGCVMVTTHAVLGNKLFCMEWKNQRKLAIFDSDDCLWKTVPVPVTGSSRIRFQFGIIDEKLLLFSMEEEPGYRTLMYDPNAAPGLEWQTSAIKPSGSCLCSVTIKA